MLSWLPTPPHFWWVVRAFFDSELSVSWESHEHHRFHSDREWSIEMKNIASKARLFFFLLYNLGQVT